MCMGAGEEPAECLECGCEVVGGDFCVACELGHDIENDQVQA